MSYKKDIEELENATVSSFYRAFPDFKTDIADYVNITRVSDSRYGDFTSTFAVQIAKTPEAKEKKYDCPTILDRTIDAFKSASEGDIPHVSLAGQGVYLNYRITDNRFWFKKLIDVNKSGAGYGFMRPSSVRRVQVEFVSANPTGPMNVVNARAAAVGDTLANILEGAGHDVMREYYINDTGVQVHNLGLSVAARMREMRGEDVEFPPDGYMGDYIKDVAREVSGQLDDEFWEKNRNVQLDVIKEKSLQFLVAEQKRQLRNYGVEFDVWFSEKALHDKGALDETLELFGKRRCSYKKDGALWLKTSDYGDEKDRVLIKEDGSPTYFLADIAYHVNKYDRGFDLIIDILGPDHHGHGIRMKAAMKALGYDPDKLMIFIVQQINLKRAGKTVKMSKRAGEFVTLDELVNEVGKDAARFFFLMRKAESHLDFDIELAKKTSNENPVYYVQYAHARICSILRKAEEEGIKINDHPADFTLLNLELDEEIELIKKLYDYQEVLHKCAELFEPHRLSNYLVELAGMFHSYYNTHRVISDDRRLTSARIYLVRGIKVVINNALTIMGISSPERM